MFHQDPWKFMQNQRKKSAVLRHYVVHNRQLSFFLRSSCVFLLSSLNFVYVVVAVV